ncbi:hypothetical protein D3C71_1594160 [compost metagenome]
MELKPDHALSVQEGLMGADRAVRQHNCLVRQNAERIVMPLKHRGLLREERKKRMQLRPFIPANRVPANLRLRPLRNLAADDIGDQLGAEAEAQHGFAALDSAADQLLL